MDLALAVHGGIHPHPSSRQRKGETKETVQSSPKPQQQEYQSPSPNPSPLPAFIDQILRMKPKRRPPVPTPSWRVASFGGLEAAGMLQEVERGKRANTEPQTPEPHSNAAPHLPSRESKLFSLCDASSFSRPCMGSGLFRGAAFSCIGLALQGEAR